MPRIGQAPCWCVDRTGKQDGAPLASLLNTWRSWLHPGSDGAQCRLQSSAPSRINRQCCEDVGVEERKETFGGTAVRQDQRNQPAKKVSLVPQR